MAPDYSGLGFKCGLEIHQQLDTRKLFCACPSIVHDENPDIHVNRKLRAVSGEQGMVDKAAKHEQSLGRQMRYEACSTSSCLVELDEEPPHQMDSDALSIVLRVANLLDAKVVDEIQVMRKTVIDGSNVSGFQRTALVAMDGVIGTSQGKVRIPTICIEEEAAKKIAADEDSVTFRLDRLGVPLIELATEADIVSPEHAKETAEKIGMVLRSAGKVKRGIGSIRQDVNVSIKDGARVEIKGFQDLRNIPAVIDHEVTRQQEAIKKKEWLEPHVRKAESDGTTSYLRPMPGASRMYPETDVHPIRPSHIQYEDVELIDDRINRYVEQYGLGEDLAKATAKSEAFERFEEYVRMFPHLKPTFIAESLVSVPKELNRKSGLEVREDDPSFKEIFSYINEGDIPKESLMDAIAAKVQGNFALEDFRALSEDELRDAIKDIVAQMEGKPFGAIMGEVMKRFKGKVDGKKANALIREALDAREDS